jgi:NDP-sugar pyrophosphorylase family protein
LHDTSIQTAIILAAGSGSKFWPYATVRHKAAFPIGNVPAIRRAVESLARLGVSRIVAVVGHGEASVRAALRGAPGDIHFVRQEHPKGTADAALLGMQSLDESVLVVAGDVVTAPQNLSTLLSRFTQDQPLAAALIQPLGREPAHSWLVAYPEGDLLRGVQGHGRSGHHRLCGVYALRPEAQGYLRDNPGFMTQVPTGGMPPEEAEIAQSLQMMIDEGQRVLAVEASAYHVDLDKPWHILEANQRVLEAMSGDLEAGVIAPSAHIHDGAEIHGRVVLGENATIGNRVLVEGDVWLGNGARVTNGAILRGNTVVGPHTTVRDYCVIGAGSSLGARGIYGHGAEFSGVALEQVYCVHYCEVWGVVGQAVDVGAATVCGNLRFDDSDTVWEVGGKREVPPYGANAAYIGDFSRTGVNAIIMPGRRIGVYSCVGPGVVLYDDLPDRQAILVKQELTTKPWGPERYGW